MCSHPCPRWSTTTTAPDCRFLLRNPLYTYRILSRNRVPLGPDLNYPLNGAHVCSHYSINNYRYITRLACWYFSKERILKFHGMCSTTVFLCHICSVFFVRSRSNWLCCYLYRFAILQLLLICLILSTNEPVLLIVKGGYKDGPQFLDERLQRTGWRSREMLYTFGAVFPHVFVHKFDIGRINAEQIMANIKNNAQYYSILHVLCYPLPRLSVQFCWYSCFLESTRNLVAGSDISEVVDKATSSGNSGVMFGLKCVQLRL